MSVPGKEEIKPQAGQEAKAVGTVAEDDSEGLAIELCGGGHGIATTCPRVIQADDCHI
jgi:hypothetical protein